MFILPDILKPLQNECSSSKLGNQRSRGFVYVLLSFSIPFTRSISSSSLYAALFGNQYKSAQILSVHGINPAALG